MVNQTRSVFNPLDTSRSRSSAGIKVRRFLRHHFAGSGDFHYLSTSQGFSKNEICARPLSTASSAALASAQRQVASACHRLRRDASAGSRIPS